MNKVEMKFNIGKLTQSELHFDIRHADPAGPSGLPKRPHIPLELFIKTLPQGFKHSGTILTPYGHEGYVWLSGYTQCLDDLKMMLERKPQ